MSFWKKLAYWQKGLIVGLFLGLFIPGVLLVLSLISDFFVGFFVVYSVLAYILLAVFQLAFKIQFQNMHGPNLVIILVLDMFLYSIWGTVIGFIIGKMKKSV